MWVSKNYQCFPAPRVSKFLNMCLFWSFLLSNTQLCCLQKSKVECNWCDSPVLSLESTKNMDLWRLMFFWVGKTQWIIDLFQEYFFAIFSWYVIGGQRNKETPKTFNKFNDQKHSTSLMINKFNAPLNLGLQPGH